MAKGRFSFAPSPPREVTDFFDAKQLQVGFDFQDVWNEEHAFAFTVAKLTELSVLRDVQDSLSTAIAEGQSFGKWKRGIREVLNKKGWGGPREVTDPETGEVRETNLTSSRRLRTIFETNMRTARSAGQWDRISRTARALPFLIYTLGPSEVHRPHHADKEGIILRWDDPFWDMWMGPNGWGCKCGVRQVAEPEARRRGWSDDTRAPNIQQVGYTNTRTGEKTRVPLGIDPGFAWNPGKARLSNLSTFLAGELDAANEGRANAAVRDFTRSPMMTRFAEGKVEGWVPVAAAPDDVRALIGADVRTVQLSRVTAMKQARKHPEMVGTAYARLQDGLRSGTLVRTDGQAHYRVLWRSGGKWWRAGFKVTRAGREIILMSMHKLIDKRAEQQLRAAERDGKVVKRGTGWPL